MNLRRTHLGISRSMQIHADDVGKDECRLLICGGTSSGAQHEIVLRLNSWHLAKLTEVVRDHFVKLAENEANARRHRERALRMPGGA